MGRHRDMLLSSKAISYSKLFKKLCVRTQAFNGRTGILNFIVQGFSLTHFKLIIGFKMESTGRERVVGLRVTFKITFSLSKIDL